MDELFDVYRKVSGLLEEGHESSARTEVIRLLDRHATLERDYPPLLNHLIREVGLYPYMRPTSSNWSERFIYEAFKVDIGGHKSVTLHREQSLLLKKLLEGENLAVSAPTSFGKSFVIDAFISIKKPKNVVIIVPTIALTDETRRRLQPKFSSSYKIITTTEVELAERNLLVFPQERAIEYADKIDEIDILIIDEFYKASYEFDHERSSSLLRAMLKLGEKAKQKYFLAPNITALSQNIFTADVSFVHLDFNTVVLEKYESYLSINGNEQKKAAEMVRVLNGATGKTLIYAGTYADIEKVSVILQDEYNPNHQNPILEDFAEWLEQNYSSDWDLVRLAKKGVGIHNGQLHRSLSQIQVRLFEEPSGLKNIISTSSIIEGVNTSAENVILWRNRNGRHRLKDFTYRNIIGRGGRMFKHFVGKVFLLEKPPTEEEIPLDIDIPDEILSDIDEDKYGSALSRDQISKIVRQREELTEVLGRDLFLKIKNEGILQLGDWNLIRDISIDLKNNPTKWRGLAFLHSSNPEEWQQSLYNVLHFRKGWWDVRYSTFVEFVKILSLNWRESTPTLLARLKPHEVGVNDFFKLERNVTYKLASLMRDINFLQKELLPLNRVDISPFVAKLTSAFMPSLVFQLEEYGLPRNISKKLAGAKILNFDDSNLSLHDVLDKISLMGEDKLVDNVPNLNSFDKYILKYFFEGIAKNPDFAS